MEKALRYQDEKSDKFWRVETLDSDLVANWGKTGTDGRYQIYEFESVEECEKQAEKMIAQKKKKGYQEFEDFDKQNHRYFDDPEIGQHMLTSHPVFRQYFSNEIYLDCGDEDAPFGSDEGSDTFYFLEEKFRKNKNLDFSDFPRYQIEEDWELTYIIPNDNQTDEELINQAKSEISGLPGDQEILQSDQVIIATAFGQIKITGEIDKKLFELALKSLNRMERLFKLVFHKENHEHVNIMRKDLLNFKKESGLL